MIPKAHNNLKEKRLTRLQKGFAHLSGKVLIRLFSNLTESWHKTNPSLPKNSKSVENILHGLHFCNFSLWHEEDQARRMDVDDSVIAKTKRAIDGFNQKRNDTIERIDTWILEQLEKAGIKTSETIELNSETPGSIIDRLSILCLKIYHMDEQAARTDVTQEHIIRAKERAIKLRDQLRDLANCLDKLISDLVNGRRRIKIYFQFKLYNDPSTNPAVYQTGKNRGNG